MTNPFPPPDFPTMYRCIGLVRGQYLPSVDSFSAGVLIAEDGSKYPAFLLNKVSKWLSDNPDQLSQSHIWSVWPRTLKDSPGLFLHLMCISHPQDETRQKAIAAAVDYFSIRGVVVFQDDGKLGVRIKRNQKPPQGKEKATAWQPFIVVVDGFLPTAKRGQFWELDCCRDGERLVMEDARLIAEASKHKEKGKEATLAAPADDPPKSPVVAPSSTAIKALPAKPAPPKGDTITIPGKLEVTLKISEFPVDAKTVNKGWKEFEIDTGNQIVTVTVKPKVFAKLEAAKQNFAQWVAAIAGKLGDRTEKGFILNEPNIQVFERKPKDQSADKVKANAVGS